MTFDPSLRSPKEKQLFLIGVTFSSLVWLAVVVSIVGLLYGLMVLSFVLMVQAVFLAHVRGNGVRVSREQLPGLYERVELAAGKLGLAEIPEVYVVQAGGTLNAFATKFLSRKFVVIYSDLVDNCHDVRHLDFIIGHEIGHLAAGHLNWNAFLLPFHLLPWLGPAYSRAREYTCDRAGHHVVADLEASMRGLCVLAAGGKLSAQVNLQAFMAQREQTGTFWMAVHELVATHPYLCKRVAALHELEAPGTLRPVRRSAASWVFAPMMGMASGSASSLALVIAIYAGILIAAAASGFQQGFTDERERLQQQSQGVDDPQFAGDEYDVDED